MGKFSKWIDLAIILLVVNSVQYNFEKNYPNELLFEKKYRHWIGSVNLMYEHESPKVRMCRLTVVCWGKWTLVQETVKLNEEKQRSDWNDKQVRKQSSKWVYLIFSELKRLIKTKTFCRSLLMDWIVHFKLGHMYHLVIFKLWGYTPVIRSIIAHII